MTPETYELKLSEILNKCRYPDVAKEKLAKTLTLLQEAGIKMTLVQKLTLSSHLCAMVERHFEGGEIPDIDKEMFSDVSTHSIELAQQVCQLLPNLVAGEKYLLSVHFESAKLNHI